MRFLQRRFVKEPTLSREIPVFLQTLRIASARPIPIRLGSHSDQQMEKQDFQGYEYVEKWLNKCRIGLGTYQVCSKTEIFDILDAALSVGYRYIDTAQVYKNEKYIGDALKVLLPKHSLKREDVFIASKLSPANQGVQNCRKSVEISLQNLQVDYIDLFLIHWPGCNKVKPHDVKNKTMRNESWVCLEELYNLMTRTDNHEHIRHVLLYHFDKGNKAEKACAKINKVYGEGTISRAQCFRWFKRFKSGDTSLIDEEGRGRKSEFDEEALLNAIEEFYREFYERGIDIWPQKWELGFEYDGEYPPDE